jgi:microcystin-dependent protein
VTGELVTAAMMNVHVRDNMLTMTPVVGHTAFYVRAATTIETVIGTNYLECNGAAVSRSTYATLFAVVNGLALPFGVGDGTTTFNLPDLRGRVPVAAGGSLALGASDGVVAANRRPQHRHTVHTHGNSARFGLGSAGYISSASSGDIDLSGTGSSADGGSGNANDSLDAPAHQVVGVWGVRFQ